MRLAVRVGQVRAKGDPARVGVLHDRYAWLAEIEGGPPGRIGIHVIVVGHRLAVQNFGAGDPAGPGYAIRRRRLHVERGPLVRVLPVPERVLSAPDGAGHVRPAGLRGHVIGGVGGCEPGGDGRIVCGGAGEGPGCQPAALLQGEPAAC